LQELPNSQRIEAIATNWRIATNKIEELQQQNLWVPRPQFNNYCMHREKKFVLT
jgi:hypothetical protein